VKRKPLLAVIALVLVSACTHRVAIALRPDFNAKLQRGHELPKMTPPLKFFRGNYTDKRQDPTLLATFKQGVNTYNLQEQRPMGDAIFEGLAAAITASGHQWNEAKDGDVRVDATFVNLQAARNAGFVMVGATTAIQVKLDFVDAKTGNLIFSNIYSGTDKREKAMLGLMGMVKDSVDASIVNCIQSVVDDAELTKSLLKAKGGFN